MTHALSQNRMYMFKLMSGLLELTYISLNVVELFHCAQLKITEKKLFNRWLTSHWQSHEILSPDLCAAWYQISNRYLNRIAVVTTVLLYFVCDQLYFARYIYCFVCMVVLFRGDHFHIIIHPAFTKKQIVCHACVMFRCALGNCKQYHIGFMHAGRTCVHAYMNIRDTVGFHSLPETQMGGGIFVNLAVLAL